MKELSVVTAQDRQFLCGLDFTLSVKGKAGDDGIRQLCMFSTALLCFAIFNYSSIYLISRKKANKYAAKECQCLPTAVQEVLR